MPEKEIQSYSVIYPNASYYNYTASTSTIIFEFLHPEEIRLVVRSIKRSKTLVCPPSASSRIKKE